MQRRTSDEVALAGGDDAPPVERETDALLITSSPQSDHQQSPSTSTSSPLPLPPSAAAYAPVAFSFLLATTLAVLSYPRGKLTWFSLHPPLLIFACVFFMPLAVWLVLRPGARRVWNHLFAQALGALFMLLGVAAVAINKETLGKAHLHTTHAQIGAAFLVVFGAQFAASSVLLWPAKRAAEREPWRVAHTVAGVAVMAAACAALWTGWTGRKIQAGIAQSSGTADALPYNVLAVVGVLAMAFAYAVQYARRRS